jgi:cell division protein YceG involved in septum cleavage
MNGTLALIIIAVVCLLGTLAYLYGRVESDKQEVKKNEAVQKAQNVAAGLSDDAVISKLRKHNSKKIVAVPKRK